MTIYYEIFFKEEVFRKFFYLQKKIAWSGLIFFFKGNQMKKQEWKERRHKKAKKGFLETA